MKRENMFGTIDLNILILRLSQQICVKVNALNWFRFYLANWSFRVGMNWILELSNPTLIVHVSLVCHKGL